MVLCPIPFQSAAMGSPKVLWHKVKQIQLNHSWDSNFPDHWFMPGVIGCVKTSFFSPSFILLFALKILCDEKRPFLILSLHNMENSFGFFSLWYHLLL